MSLVSGLIWNCILPIKLFFLAWRILHNFLSFKDNLQLKGITLVSICACCQDDIETNKHMLIDGPVANEVWDHFYNIFGMQEKRYICISALLMDWYFQFPKLDYIISELLFLSKFYGLFGRKECSKIPGGCFLGYSHYQVEFYVNQLGVAKVFKNIHFKGDADNKWKMYV